MNLRRARPTIRVLREDLESGWNSPQPQRHLRAKDLGSLHPMSELDHPLLAKALSSFTDNPEQDNYVGPIASSTNLPLLEIKAGQWRGGVWIDHKQNVCWLVVAGLAKGEHEDRDDFYQTVARNDLNSFRWLPDEVDVRLLKRERAALLLSEWDMAIQRQVAIALREVCAGGESKYELLHPIPEQGRMGTVTVVVAEVREDGYEADEIVVDVVPEPRYAGHDLFWHGTTRILISLSPPEQEWDRVGYSYSNIADPEHWVERATALEQMMEDNVLAESVSGQVAHYSHREHIASSVVSGTGMRALCGVYFVNTQLPDDLPPCPNCTERWNRLPVI